MNKEKLIAEIFQAYDNFIAALQKFSEAEFNTPPFEGSWTPGQVADHIFKATKALPDRNAVPSTRAYDEKVPAIENIFLNFETKLKSPEFVYPTPGPFDKDQMIEQLISIRNKQKARIEERDLTQICEGFSLPHTGTMTRFEWLTFFIVHIKRHTHQLNNMIAVKS